MFSLMTMSVYFFAFMMGVYNNVTDTDQILSTNHTPPPTVDITDCEGNSSEKYQLCSKQNCSNNCLQNNNISQTCDNITGHCMHCIPGYFGAFCQHMCNDNCIDPENGGNICEQNTGECQKCKNGYFGRFCADNCFENCDMCDQKKRICNKCKSNYYGEKCNFTCPVDCSTERKNTTNKIVCHRETGECLTCKYGLYGNICNKTCPTNCGIVSDLTTQKCIKSNGHCINCKLGYYGTFCEQTCSKTCQNMSQGKRLCAKGDGKCSLGCIGGWHGIMSQYTCSTTCKYHTCNQWTGQCSKGCIVGYEGQYCESKKIVFEPQAFGNVITVNEGTLMKDINCVSVCDPVCDIEWETPSNDKNNSKHEPLHLDRAFREKAGVYTCLVKDPRLGRTFNKNVTVNIRYGPDLLHILPQENYLSIKIGGTAPLVKCIADCYPSCNFQWTKLNDSSVLVDNATLQLGTATHKESGVYTCTATNAAEEYPKSNSLSLEIEITALIGNNGLKTSNCLVMLIGVCAASSVTTAVAVCVAMVISSKRKQRRKRKRRRMHLEVPPTVDDGHCGEVVYLNAHTVGERASGSNLYDEVVQTL